MKMCFVLMTTGLDTQVNTPLSLYVGLVLGQRSRQTDIYFIDRKEKSLQTYLS